MLKKLKDTKPVEGSESKFSKKEELDKEVDKRKNTISDNQYVFNIVIMSIQWSAASFSFYMLMFMNKYYEGSIYVNNYLDAIAGLLGSTISILIYKPLRIRWSYISSITFSLIGGVFYLCFQ